MQILKVVEAVMLACLFFISPRGMSAQRVLETMGWEEHISTQECICDIKNKQANSIAPTGYKTKNWTLETHFEEHRAVRNHGTMSSLGEGDGFNDKLV